MAESRWEDQPRFVCGHRKSGTTLLVSLFDAHPQLCVFPDDSGFWYGYYPRFASNEYTDEQKVQRLVNVMFHQLRAGLGRLEAARNREFPFDAAEDDFRGAFAGHELHPATVLSEAVQAFRHAFLPAGDDRLVGWIEKTTSTEIYASDVFTWYPNAKMIHLVRDPRDNYASLKSGWTARYSKYNDSVERLLQSVLERGLLGLKLASLNQARFGGDAYRVVRYEDLTTDPEATMRSLAAFLGIDFDSVLLRPSYLGLPWKGNNFEGESFVKPSPDNVGRWRERITHHEAALIEFHFEHEIAAWGYDLEFSRDERMDAATQHYKWFNFAQQFSSGGVADTFGAV